MNVSFEETNFEQSLVRHLENIKKYGKIDDPGWFTFNNLYTVSSRPGYKPDVPLNIIIKVDNQIMFARDFVYNDGCWELWHNGGIYRLINDTVIYFNNLTIAQKVVRGCIGDDKQMIKCQLSRIDTFDMDKYSLEVQFDSMRHYACDDCVVIYKKSPVIFATIVKFPSILELSNEDNTTISLAPTIHCQKDNYQLLSDFANVVVDMSKSFM